MANDMTASLDRAAEAALREYRPMRAIYYPEQEMRAALLAALPHLGVDREALRGLAEKWRAEASKLRGYAKSPPRLGGGEESESTYRAMASEIDACISELLHLIETNQEPEHAR